MQNLKELISLATKEHQTQITTSHECIVRETQKYFSINMLASNQQSNTP